MRKVVGAWGGTPCMYCSLRFVSMANVELQVREKSFESMWAYGVRNQEELR
jgi:hypothetical protein